MQNQGLIISFFRCCWFVLILTRVEGRWRWDPWTNIWNVKNHWCVLSIIERCFKKHLLWFCSELYCFQTCQLGQSEVLFMQILKRKSASLIAKNNGMGKGNSLRRIASTLNYCLQMILIQNIFLDFQFTPIISVHVIASHGFPSVWFWCKLDHPVDVW